MLQYTGKHRQAHNCHPCTQSSTYPLGCNEGTEPSSPHPQLAGQGCALSYGLCTVCRYPCRIFCFTLCTFVPYVVSQVPLCVGGVFLFHAGPSVQELLWAEGAGFERYTRMERLWQPCTAGSKAAILPCRKPSSKYSTCTQIIHSRCSKFTLLHVHALNVKAISLGMLQ